MFERLGRLAHRRRILILLLTVVAAVLSGIYGVGGLDRMKPGGFEDPGSESHHAAQLAAKAFPEQAPDAVIVYRNRDLTVDDPAFREAVSTRIDALPASSVTASVTYWQSQRPQQVSKDRHATYVAINLRGGDDNAKEVSWAGVKDVLAVPGYQVLRGGAVPSGQQVGDQIGIDLGLAEGLSFPLLFLLLVFVFRGLVAALLPLLVGGLSILGSLAVLRLITTVSDVSVFAMSLVSMLGLAVAIDYGLFIVSRYREEMANGYTGADALTRTLATAGRTVAVSGLTVTAALAGMSFFPFNFLKSMAFGGMAAVSLAVFFSLVTLPAVLAVLGTRVNKFSVGRRKKSTSHRQGLWYRLAHGVMRRPVPVALLTLGVLLALAVPFLKIEFGVNDARQLPAAAEGRKVFDQMARDFDGDGTKAINAVLELPGEAASPAQQTALTGYRDLLRAVPGVRGAEITGASGTTAQVSVQYDGVAVSQPSRDLVDRLREVPPPAGAKASLGGESAAFDDTLDSLGETLPWMLLYIAIATYILLFLAFGSVLLPLKAIAMNLVSLSATFGILVWIFQEGHLSDLLRFDSTGNIEPNMPIMLFALIFGLSMDYEVFLVSRVREHYDHLGDSNAAVATGLQSTGKLITSAALLMIVPLAALGTSQVLAMKLFGVGMVVAVILDATVVRILLVPATMKLLGRAAWWAPGPLRRLYARYGIKESSVIPTSPAPVETPVLSAVR